MVRMGSSRTVTLLAEGGVWRICRANLGSRNHVNHSSCFAGERSRVAAYVTRFGLLVAMLGFGRVGFDVR